MAHTASVLTARGTPYEVIGRQKRTTTDITWSGATASETVTAAELGLNVIESCDARINAAVASATGVEASTTISSDGSSVVIALNTVAAAGTGQAGSIVRVTALGY